jgi:hypothetical protein
MTNSTAQHSTAQHSTATRYSFDFGWPIMMMRKHFWNGEIILLLVKPVTTLRLSAKMNMFSG